jgi:uncharacterized sporulation protein YeaH/YhbH (DUF444 family)
MSNVVIVDRRLVGQDKHLSNRERFLRRQKAQVKKAIDAAVAQGSVKGKYDDINVEVHGTTEPAFINSSDGGTDHFIAPGNQWFVKGDRFRRPEMDSGEGEGGEGDGAGQGQGGDDSFSFVLSRKEFLEYFFEDLGLPDVVRKANAIVEVVASRRAGFKPEGNPAQLDLRRSAYKAAGRRLALGRPNSKEMEEIEREIQAAKDAGDEEAVQRLEIVLDSMKRKRLAVAFFDPIDLQYRQYVDVTVPKERVVLFCIMDVSGSMGEREKDIAKRYFILLLLLLERNYGDGKVEVVFIRHHSTAEECSEEDFFYKRESGGTMVSSATDLMAKIIKDRYPSNEYNIYGAQASDGDNWGDDNNAVKHTLEKDILPLCQYYTYIDIPHDLSMFGSSTLWPMFKELDEQHDNLAARQIGRADQIWHVFKNLFSKGKEKK